MKKPYSEESVFGGKRWHISPNASLEENMQLVHEFFNAHVHEGWSLSIFNTLESGLNNTAEIDCPFSEMSAIVEFLFHQEKAYPIEWIGENPVSKSYVVGMPCYRGRLSIPGLYKAKNGRLEEIVL